jgi:hypothetical protein
MYIIYIYIYKIMSLTIKNFKVINTTTGKIQQSGRRQLSYLETVVSSKTFLDNLVEKQLIPGTPSTISSGGLVGNAHMSSKYIKIDRDTSNINQIDHLYIPTKLRVTKISGNSSAQNMICYGWSSSLSTVSTDITWNVLFSDFNSQDTGDYIDIDLPDQTYYPNLYLALILINDAWKSRTVVNETFKICSVPGNLDYFSIDPSKSNSDISSSHAIIIQANNSIYGIKNRICIAFEDWYMAQTDKDYNDVVIALQDVSYDNNNINDTSIQ